MRSSIGYFKLIWLVPILLVCSCSAQWHLNRAVQKKPSILTTKTQVWDTTIVTKERVAIDTIWTSKDTTIVRDSVVITYRVLGNGKAEITAKCPPESVKIKKEIVTKVVTKDSFEIRLFLWVVILMVVAYFIKLTLQMYGTK
jgi:hypothetical protein